MNQYHLMIHQSNLSVMSYFDDFRKVSTEYLCFRISFIFCHLDFSYLDKRTGIRWITTKSRSQPINKLLSRFSWKTKINHYKKYSDISRMRINLE